MKEQKKRTLADLMADPNFSAWLEEKTKEMDTNGALKYLYDAKACMARRKDMLQRQYNGTLFDKVYEAYEYMSIGSCKLTADGVEYPSIVEYANSRYDWSVQSKIRYMVDIRKAVIMDGSFAGVEYRDARVFSGGFANRYRSVGKEEIVRDNINMKRSVNRAFWAWPKDNPDERKAWKNMTALSRWLGHSDNYVSQAIGQGYRIASKDGDVEYVIGKPVSSPVKLKKPVLKLVGENGETSFYFKKKDASAFLDCDPAQLSRAIKSGKPLKGFHALEI